MYTFFYVYIKQQVDVVSYPYYSNYQTKIKFNFSGSLATEGAQDIIPMLKVSPTTENYLFFGKISLLQNLC